MFSRRLPPHADINTLTRALDRLRSGGVSITDLTESNPTKVGFEYPADLLDGLSSEGGYRYDPQPLGLRAAREAIAADYMRRGARIDPAHVVLSASTSEAYSWVFKLLCDAGQGVLVPEPSYPLFEHLTRLEAVRAVPYRLRFHGRWEIDVDSLAGAAEITHVNLNDGVVEGLRVVSERAFSVQYHPEAAPGPHDATYLFDEFTRLMEASR